MANGCLELRRLYGGIPRCAEPLVVRPGSLRWQAGWIRAGELGSNELVSRKPPKPNRRVQTPPFARKPRSAVGAAERGSFLGRAGPVTLDPSPTGTARP